MGGAKSKSNNPELVLVGLGELVSGLQGVGNVMRVMGKEHDHGQLYFAWIGAELCGYWGH